MWLRSRARIKGYGRSLLPEIMEYDRGAIMDAMLGRRAGWYGGNTPDDRRGRASEVAALEAVAAARTADQREGIIRLLGKYAPITNELTMDLFESVRAGSLIEVTRALERGADVRSRDAVFGNDAETPLIAAAGAGHEAIVALLLSRECELNARTASGWTALMRACNAGEIGCTRLLLDAGADPALRNEEGYTALGRIPGNLPDLIALVASRGGQL
jgi:hypothetical protein